VSKKALEDFTVGLAQELRDFEIQVNCISPADVATEAYVRFYPEYAAAAVQPEEVAEVVVALVSDQFRHVTGQIIEVRNRADHE
jgi:NAD(P)-dependent dehydrogenase (short-subunit alcohol dehydrogenase family)